MDKSFNLFIGFFIGCSTTVGLLYFLGNNYKINYNKKKGLEFIDYNKVVNNKKNIDVVKHNCEKEIKLMMKEDKNIQNNLLNKNKSNINIETKINDIDNEILNKDEVSEILINSSNKKKLIFTDSDSEILDDSEIEDINNMVANKFCLLQYFKLI